MAQPTELEQELALKTGIAETELIIIDDDPLFRLMLQDYLYETEEMGSELFDNGALFLSKYKSDDKRKIILDYEFDKGPDGLEVLKRLKKINPMAKVIVVSGVDDLEKALETIRSGASDYFLKTNTTVFANIVCSIKMMKELERLKFN